MTNIDDVAQRLSEYERLAITSGATVQIDPPEYSDGGSIWSPFWIGAEHPKVARVTVRRDGVPTTVYASWDESLPVDTAQTDDGRLWRDIWEAKPMERFGSFVVRAGLRRAFREVIGEPVEPDEDAPKVAPAPVRDWEAEIDKAADVAAVDALHKEMKVVRAVTPSLEAQLRSRREAAAWAPSETPGPPRMNDHTVVAPGNVPGIRPQDHLPPTNRAARRAGKGRRK